MTQGLELWVGIYHVVEESTPGITGAHMLDDLEKCSNVAVQKTLPIPILDIEADFTKECNLVYN